MEEYKDKLFHGANLKLFELGTAKKNKYILTLIGRGYA
jgi:hypothetical protein